MLTQPWVLVSGGFHSHGGMDKANLAIAEYLIGQKVPIEIVTYSADKCLHENKLVNLHIVPKLLNSFTLARPLLDRKGRYVSRLVTSRFQRAIVIVNGSNCNWPGVNWAHYVHHAWPVNNQNATFFEKTIHAHEMMREESAFKRSPLVIANSNVTRSHLLQYFKLNPEIVKTLYLGSDPNWSGIKPDEREDARAKFDIAKNRHCAVFVGALGNDGRKGIDTLTAAWKFLCQDSSWDVDLLVAGGGRQLDKLRSDVAASRLQHRVRFLGFYNNIREVLAAADILVSPTRYEPYGLNVQEAICTGVPSIVSAASGIAERFPKSLKSLLLCQPDDVHQLVTTLKLWRSNITVWKSRFEPLAVSLRANTWEAMAKNFVSLADSAVTPVSN